MRGGLRLAWESMTIARDPDSVSRDAAFLASQLLCHHACIDELALRCVANTGRLEKPAFFIDLRPSSSAGESVRVIRSLIVCEMPFEEARREGTLYTLQGVDAIGCLETLLFRSHGYKTKFTSDLGALLQHNRNSLKFVHGVCSEEAMHSRDHQIQTERLWGQSFVGLNIFDTFTAIDAIKPLLEASTHLTELTVNVHGSELSVFAEAVAAMKTLTKLVVMLHNSTQLISNPSGDQWSTPAVLFDVLKVNSTLNCLCARFSLLSPDCERALASALRTNATLRHLELSDFQCTSSLADLAEALSDNTTLEFLELNTSSLQITSIAALCRALSTNKTLKTLALRLKSGFGTHDERVALADELTHSGSYSRICVPLAEPDLPGLTAILASVTACPQELDCSDIWHFKNALLISLFDAVATSYAASIVRMLDYRCHVFDPKAELESFHFEDGGNVKPIEDQTFMFCQFFDETEDHVYVFENTTRAMLTMLLEGCNCSVLACISTGTDKDFAMLGSKECPAVVSLMASELYQRAPKLQSEGQTCDSTGLFLSIQKVKEAGTLLEPLLKGKNRTQHATDANAESSWSHAIFQSYATERAAAASRDTKDQMREGTKLNLSLLALGNCINGRSKNGTHALIEEYKEKVEGLERNLEKVEMWQSVVEAVVRELRDHLVAKTPCCKLRRPAVVAVIVSELSHHSLNYSLSHFQLLELTLKAFHLLLVLLDERAEDGWTCSRSH
ncbi:uncharacterized protein LOC125942236 [Dermacentor silvarum]|uniref:uncharacterized protein LOC125942236 n=1 Tax=Dermacentor silvarum TaxID=543639 RepID=UPI002101CC50|nr:uncharacterized protein LOC125942236 [Dermacentor silvarum]